jgi:hypothetical protein
MNPNNKPVLREEIQWLLEAISEQFDAINKYEDKIPQIEFDIIMENVRKLYENLHVLNRMGDSFLHMSPAKKEVSETEPVRSESSHMIQPQKGAEKRPEQKGVKIKVETSATDSLEKDHSRVPEEIPEIDLFPVEHNEFSEKLKETREKSYASERLSSQKKELKAVISINEKFLFINELFDGNLREYNIAIETLNGFAEFKQALEFLDLMRLKNLWESESTAFKRLRELVEQKF